MRTSTRRLVAGRGSLLLLAGCFGAYQVSPDDVQTVGSLKPNVEDKDAGPGSRQVPRAPARRAGPCEITGDALRRPMPE